MIGTSTNKIKGLKLANISSKKIDVLLALLSLLIFKTQAWALILSNKKMDLLNNIMSLYLLFLMMIYHSFMVRLL